MLFRNITEQSDVIRWKAGEVHVANLCIEIAVPLVEKIVRLDECGNVVDTLW